MAFLLRCKGPRRTSLEPTPIETFPAKIVILESNDDSFPVVDGERLKIGDTISTGKAANITVNAGNRLLMLVIFSKR